MSHDDHATDATEATSTDTSPEPAGEPADQAATDQPTADQAAGGRGLRQLEAEEFDALASVGGVRGLVETVLPGVVFVVLFVITRDLMPPLIASVAVAVVAATARLIGRTPLTQAVSGLLGVAIGAVWAWRTGEAADYYRWGLYVNLAWAVGVLVSILVRWPVVGVVASLLAGRNFSWRQDRDLRRRYVLASWLWVAAFTLRLVVQVPLYLESSVGWLGTARLVMGLPMWALVLWITWLLVRRRAAPAAQPGSPAAPR
ncbi:DUF3159 domain-containing protein [Ruania albidiflava]|uniref:DUF3159 domain-containing protein n=1 Tax=Ruania albidiflava TaxID=366586 RepID=UPI0023F18B16|nr:DUF3159 domain-containing protein [Ruania albidiflava]